MFGVLTSIDDKACSSFKIQSQNNDSEFGSILLIDSESCNLNVKALNAQTAGAIMVIFINHNAIDQVELINNSMDPISMKVNIPSIIVSQETGEKLQSVFKANKIVILKFKMPIPKGDKVQLNINIKLGDTKIYTFLKDFQPYLGQFGDNLSVNYLLFKRSENDPDVPLMQMTLDCLSSENAASIMIDFGEECKEKTIDCFNNLVQKMNKEVYEKTIKCAKNSTLDFSNLQNILKQETINTNSFLLINHMIFTGSLKADNVFQAICGAFAISPDQCLYVENQYTLNNEYTNIKQSKNKKTFWILVINIAILVFLLSIAAIIMIIVFGRIYKRILEEKVSIIVKDSIVNYQTLKTMN